MIHRAHAVLPMAAGLALLVAGIGAPARPSSAQPLSGSGYTPKVPVSAFARPLGWFDPSRLRVSTSVSVGSGFGRGTEALQVTRLSYQFGSPVSMAVSLGNSWGLGSARSGRSFFLEGMDFAYRPHSSVVFEFHYRDVRSPLQYSPFASPRTWSP